MKPAETDSQQMIYIAIIAWQQVLTYCPQAKNRPSTLDCPHCPRFRASYENLQQIDLTKFLEKEFFDVADESGDAVVNGEVEQRRGDLRGEAMGLIRIFDTVQIIEKQNKS